MRTLLVAAALLVPVPLARPAPRGGPPPDQEREVVRFPAGEVELVGTLLLPEGPGPHPGLVIAHGSEGVPRESRAYMRFAERFHALGLAVLVFDRRGVGDSGGTYVESPDLRAAADDLIAAVRAAGAHPRVDAERVGVWGVSQGGWVGPLAATRCDDVAFVVAVSGPGVSPLEQNLFDKENQLRARGFPDDVVEAVTEMRRLHWTYLVDGTGREDMLALWDVLREEPWFGDVEWPIPMGEREALLAHPRLRDFAAHNGYEPRPVLERLRVPFLAVFGAEDRIVPVEESVRVMRAALAVAGNDDVTIRVFPEGDHGLRHEVDGERRFVPGYLELLDTWLRERAGIPNQVHPPTKSHSGSPRTGAASPRAPPKAAPVRGEPECDFVGG